MEGIAPYTRAMDATTPLTTDERLERIEETMKRATIRLEGHIDAVSLRKLGITDWCAICFKASVGIALMFFELAAVGALAAYVGVTLLRVLTRH
jgi:hypothetical protein